MTTQQKPRQAVSLPGFCLLCLGVVGLDEGEGEDDVHVEHAL